MANPDPEVYPINAQNNQTENAGRSGFFCEEHRELPWAAGGEADAALAKTEEALPREACPYRDPSGRSAANG